LCIPVFVLAAVSRKILTKKAITPADGSRDPHIPDRPVFRALAALVLIPLHFLAAAFEPEQTTGERIGRVFVFVLFGAALGFFIYKVEHPS